MEGCNILKTNRGEELLRALSVVDNFVNLGEPSKFDKEEKDAILSIKMKLKEWCK